MEKVKVIPWLPRGEGSSHSAVGTSVICCYLCCLFSVFQLGCNQVQSLHRDYNTSGSLNLFSKKFYDL